MKIFYVSNARLPSDRAHGWQIANTCHSLAENGAKVVLLCPNRANDIKEDLFSYYSLERKFSLIYLPTLNLFLNTRFGFVLQNITYQVVVIFYLVFKRLIQKEETIVYARGDAILSLVWLSKIYPVFWETHIRPMGKAWDRYQYFYKKLAGTITITRAYQEELVRDYFWPSEKVICVPDAVNLEEINVNLSQEEARSKLNLPLDHKIILYTGSFFLYSWKGVDTLIESAKLLPSDFLVLIVGGEEKHLSEIREKYPEVKNLLAHGYVKHELIPVYLRAADAVVLPNKGEDEVATKYTSPLKLFEYLASGRPIISSDILSAREILSEDTAFFFKSSDPVDLAQKIKECLASRAVANEKAEKAKILSRDYSWYQRGGKIINFIEKQLAKK